MLFHKKTLWNIFKSITLHLYFNVDLLLQVNVAKCKQTNNLHFYKK